MTVCPVQRLRKAEWVVRSMDQVTAEDLVTRLHYSKGGANTATFRHGLFRRDDRWHCFGVAWWMPPTKGAALAIWEGDWRQVLMLHRLAIEPEVPVNGASFLLGQSIKRIKRNGFWRCLVTYADMAEGHTGAIYKATNWTYLGQTQPETIWRDQENRMISRKAGPKTRTRTEMIALGYQDCGKSSKHRFRMILPENHHRQKELFE